MQVLQLLLEEGEVCLQLLCLSKSKSAGCEATVSHETPALHFFCLASSLKRSIIVPHLSLSALLLCIVSRQLIRKPSSLSWAFILGVRPQSSLNTASGTCFCFG